MPTLTPTQLLLELEPVVAENLDRHLAIAQGSTWDVYGHLKDEVDELIMMAAVERPTASLRRPARAGAT